MGEIAKHPILTMDSLACPGVRLTRISRIVAYQIHERCDGSGYPRGMVGDDLHVLSKIARGRRRLRRTGVKSLASKGADAVLRNGEDAAQHSARSVRSEAVRGLLHATSLFPLGSFIQTTDGRFGRVVRSTGENYTQPMISLWNPKTQEFDSNLINLAQDESLQIRRAIARLPQ